MSDIRFSDNDASRRDIPSFIEPHPPLISNPFMRPRPQKGTNLMDLFEEDSESEEPELVRVYLRLKPCNVTNNLYEVRSDRCLITSLDTTTAGHGRRTQHNVSKMYTFSHIFGAQANQKEIFENVVKDNLRKLPEGHNFTLLTYGASGSGKTYTLMGTVASPGLVPRSLEYVFKVVDAAQQPLYKPSEGGADSLNYAQQDYELQWVKRLRQLSAPLRDKYRRMSIKLGRDMTTSNIDLSNRTRYYVWVSFVEIYNEAIYDLLVPGDKRNASKLLIREDSNGLAYVKGATQAFVRTGEEAYDVLVAGKHNLQVAATGVHAQSSRSHCIFTITMLTHTDEGVRVSCVRLCDLAGCERARRTRNAGARMQESRAINSSLHVLERCLHTLRRKQRAARHALVPYRESKLTRLLGAGLSGAKGEAVSMVVTLNPSPEYAHETKHVLQLAAVAKDIQINNTISDYPSTLESSRSDSLLDGSAEIMKLRAENERLHFELIQAHTRNEELAEATAARQASAVHTIQEMVAEARDIERTFYEERLRALRIEMEEMAEDYESRLSKLTESLPPETASTSLQNTITQLMTEIAILEEKLVAEKLARARAEEEVQHLRACIEERDEKSSEEIAVADNDDVMSLTDSDNESDGDENLCNESLEPTFTKEDINRSRMIRQSLLHTQNTSFDVSTESGEKSEDSVLEKSTDTIKDLDNSNSLDTYPNEEKYNNIDESTCSLKRLTLKESVDKCTDDDSFTSYENTDKIEGNKKTYPDDEIEGKAHSPKCDVDLEDKIKIETNGLKNEAKFKSICRGTYFISEPIYKKECVKEVSDDKNLTETNDTINICDVKKIDNSQYETIVQKEDKLLVKSNDSTDITDYEECVDIMNNIETVNITQSTEEVDNDKQGNILRNETLVNKIIKSLKSTSDINNSLDQFEQLEKETIDRKSDNTEEAQDCFYNIKVLKEKRHYFDETEENFKDKTLERNIDHGNICDKIDKKRLTDVANEFERPDDLRSPSIVKEEATKDFESSALQKLLGKGFAQPELKSAIQTKKATIKKQDSIDVFESPQGIISQVKHEKISIATIVTCDKDTSSVLPEIKVTPSSPFKLPIVKIQEEVKVVAKSIENIVTDDRADNNIVIHTANTDVVVEKQISDNGIGHRISKIKSSVKEEKLVMKSCKEEILIPDNFDQSCRSNNTVEEFENIYNDITAPRATAFELLVTQEISESQVNETIGKVNDTIGKVNDTSAKVNETIGQVNETHDEVKYNFRHRSHPKPENVQKDENRTVRIKDVNEVLLESEVKSEMKPRRTLRLRRRKANDDSKETELQLDKVDKLKDIVNLQSEFSDVTIDVPAVTKDLKDIPSPVKIESDAENLPPTMGIQSCPSKSVTRSRRKLFTPRAEPLDESAHGESDERVRVPRPSYHRPRARRKL